MAAVAPVSVLETRFAAGHLRRSEHERVVLGVGGKRLGRDDELRVLSPRERDDAIEARLSSR